MAKFKVVKGKLIQITDGYVNLGKKLIGKESTDIETLAKHRLSICDRCEYRAPKFCRKCGCALAAKTRSKTSSCPLNKW